MASQSADTNPEVVPAITPELQADLRVLPTIPEYLERGVALKRWWHEIEARGGPENKFSLTRNFNQPTRSYGFYAEAPVDNTMLPVMGNVQEMFYDQTRAPASLGRDSAEWMWMQIREFVMKYFLRVTSFREPAAYIDASYPTPPPALARLSWCPSQRDTRLGFGFQQLFNKPVGRNEVRPFPSYERFAVVDQRDIGRIYDWIVLKVRIFDFSFNVRPFGENGPELLFGENEESYLVVNEEFVNHVEHPAPGVLGDYGIGYAVVRNPTPGPFSYGPGEFDAGFQTINFRVYETGYVSVRMIFVANRPTAVANLVIDPVKWSFRLADFFSFDLASELFSSARGILDQLPLRISFDPILAYIYGANLVSGGYAARTLCISMERLEKFFLLQHFKQHYETIIGSLLTWRQIPDWLDEKNLPSWVRSGASS
jgi:hypothetical protein